MSINVRLEQTVRGFLSGVEHMRLEKPTEVNHIINHQGVSEHHPVLIGHHNFITGESKTTSWANTAAALSGLRGQLILDTIMSMELDTGSGYTIPAAQFDTSDPKQYLVPIVCSLGAVYEAVNYLITRQIVHSHREQEAHRKANPKRTNKRNGKANHNKPTKAIH